MRQDFRKHVPSILAQIHDAKPLVAWDDQAKDELAAILAAWVQNHVGAWTDAEFSGVLSRELRPSIPEAFQLRPIVRDLPKPWIDPITGLPAANPWAEDSVHLESQQIIMEVDPVLAEHLERVAKGGVTYAFLHKLNLERKQKREVIEMKYGDDEHSVNPWVKGDGLAQMRVEEANPFLASFLQRQAKPITLNPCGPTQNMTRAGIILNTFPAHHELLQSAAVIHSNWLHEDVIVLDGEVARALALKNKAEARLRGSKGQR